ncbi:MFS transporter [Phytoactinopolyspora halotolerans]|uniref:MFS transporter n=2 Tax=Phytoactinopolyspora halotolerans TaxID=1981512 RepID=A0A6L9SAY3_9ACTN|nr:MFS transporter [Phytoactinopolyspora halotolerans]
MNLRPAITSVGPVLDRVQSTLGTSDSWAGLLTTIPVLCFAFGGLLAPALARRAGMRAVIWLGLGLVAVGLVLRAMGGPFVVLGATLLAAAGISLIAVLMPAVVKGAYPSRVGTMTGAYTAALQFGAVLGFALTSPLADAFAGWRPALAFWAVLALIALTVWLPASRNTLVLQAEAASATSLLSGPTSPAPPNRPTSPSSPQSPQRLAPKPPHCTANPPGSHSEQPATADSLFRSRLAWTITVFFGLQAMIAFVIIGWLPQVLMDAGVSRGESGLLLALLSLIAVPISLLIPPMAVRQSSQSGWIIALGASGLAGLTGLITAPGAAPLLWSILLGLGMSVFSLALVVIALRTRTTEVTAKLSGMAQGVGYLIAATGPFFFGFLHESTGDWNTPLTLLTAVLVIQIIAGALAGRPRTV